MIPDEPPITDPPIYRTLVNDGEKIRPVDTIEHEGKFWLVFRWLSPPSKEWRQPERLVRHAILPCRDLRHLPDRPYGADFSLEAIMPKLLFGEIPLLPSEQYVVVEHPLLRMRIPTDF